jgi:hypothetical protein
MKVESDAAKAERKSAKDARHTPAVEERKEE